MVHAKLFMQSRGQPHQNLTNTYKISENIQDVADNRMLLLMSENRTSMQKGNQGRDPLSRGNKAQKTRQGKHRNTHGKALESMNLQSTQIYSN